MKIFTTSEIRRIEEYTIKVDGIIEIDLMERAASAAAFEIMSRWQPGKRFVVFAGPGNNGGDALAVARLLKEQGYERIEVFLFNISDFYIRNISIYFYSNCITIYICNISIFSI